MNKKNISTFFSRMRPLHMHRRQRFYCCTAILSLIFIMVGEYLMHPVNDDKIITDTNLQAWPNDIPNTPYQTGCVMPKLDPFSEEAMKSNNVVPAITCVDIDWVSCYKTKCSVKQKIINEMKSIECIYKDIIYLRNDSYYFGEPSKVLWTDEYILNKSDHVKVSCTGTEVNGFGESHWSGNKAGFRDTKTSKPIEAIENSTNVLIVMFDSSSRNGFIRRMPKSYKTLTNQFQAVVFESHNIVGEGTAGALFPIMTGHNELELEDSGNIANSKYVNGKSFLFHVLKENGYQTALLKDYPEIGQFQQLFNMFERGQPADHYLRPFFMEAANDGWWYKRQKYCVGDQPVYRFLLNLTSQFFELPGKKFCFTMICETSHDDFNVITAADDDLVSFLKTFKRDRRLRDTLLIVMGDTGSKLGSIRDTYQGKVEERLPFMSIVLPSKLRSQKHNALLNLRNNKNVLTTHYDIHTTVLDSLGLQEYRNSYKVPGSNTERGLSFLEPIPKTRTCAEAGVMPHWCVCLEWHNLDSSHVMYREAAAALVGYIDSIIEEKRSKCSKRNLLAIDWVISLRPNEQILSYKKEIERYTQTHMTAEKTHERAESEYYRAKIVLGPGRPGIFECLMRFIVKDKIFVIFEKDITRVNAYGDEPKCVSSTHPHLNKYCYCRDYSLSLGSFGLVGY